eukprot:1662310-Rhodomonas_salina.1
MICVNSPHVLNVMHGESFAPWTKRSHSHRFLSYAGMGLSTEDTVFALSSAPGKSGVAVFRISGKQTRDALLALTGTRLPAHRVASLRKIRDPSTSELLDTGLVIWFEGPHSFTGEDTAELH